MEIKKHKEYYDTPSTMVFEVKQGGVICASDVEGSNSIVDWGNGGDINDEIFM